MRRSPFSMFRDNAKILMVVLIALSMFAFIIMDQLSPANFPYIVGFLLGAAAFWLIGRQAGKPIPYTIAGAILGVAFTFFMTSRVGESNTVVTTTAGDLSKQQVDGLIRERQVANQFLGAALVTVASKPNPAMAEQSGTEMAAMMQNYFARMAQQQSQLVMFSYGYPRIPIERDVVFGWLLRQEAEEMGIRITDEAINEYIVSTIGDAIRRLSGSIPIFQQSAPGRLTKEDFILILRTSNFSEDELYESLRHELMAQRVWELKHPTLQSTPRQYWDDYRKFQVRTKLDVAEIPVSAFIDDVELPGEENLRKFFDEHKEVFPHVEGPGEPGFLQPQRASVAYLKADFSKIRQTVDKPSVAEIEEYYAENRAEFVVRSLFDEFGDEPIDDRPIDPFFQEEPSEEGTDTKSSTEPPRPPAIPAPDISDGEPSADPDGAVPDDAEPKPKAEPDAVGPDAEGPKTEEPKTEEPSATDDEPSATDETDAADDGPNEGDGAASFDFDRIPLQFIAQTESATDAPDDAADAPAESDTATESPQSASATVPQDDAKTDDENEDAPAGSEIEEGEDDSPAEPVASPPDGSLTITPGESKKVAGPPSPPPVPQYRILDEALRAEIRDKLLKQRTIAEIVRRIDAARGEMSDLSDTLNRIPREGETHIADAEVDDRLQEIAKRHGLNFVETPLLDEREFIDSDEFEIGKSTIVDPTLPSGQTNSRNPVLQEIFSPDSPRYQPMVAVDKFDDSRFVYWKTGYAARHVPLFEPISPKADIQLTELNRQLGPSAFPEHPPEQTLSQFLVKLNGGRIPQKDATLVWNQYRITVEETRAEGISEVRIAEPGIRTQVEAAWKQQQAQPLAEKRARKLAEQVRKSKKPLPDTLAGISITGKANQEKKDEEEQDTVELRQTNSFSWLTLSSAPSTDMRAPLQPSLSEIPAVPNAGFDFMRTVFETLNVGEVGVAPNADRSAYYVVQVTERTPRDPVDDAKFRRGFIEEDVVVSPDQQLLMASPQATPYERLDAERRQEIILNWADELRAKYDLKWRD